MKTLEFSASALGGKAEKVKTSAAISAVMNISHESAFFHVDHTVLRNAWSMLRRGGTP